MRTVRRSKAHKTLIDTLYSIKDQNTDMSVFKFIKSLQCYAALLGFQEGKRMPFDNEDKENIEWRIFETDGYTDYIFLIALAETQDTHVLKYDEVNSDTDNHSEDMVKIFEEYANGGFHILQSWMDKSPGDPYGTNAIIAGLQKSGLLNQNEQKPVLEDVEF